MSVRYSTVAEAAAVVGLLGMLSAWLRVYKLLNNFFSFGARRVCGYERVEVKEGNFDA